MSHLTRPPFKKLSPLDLTGPRLYHPISPPETEVTTDSTSIIPPRDMNTLGANMEAANAYMKYSKVDVMDSYVPSLPVPMPEIGGKYRRPSNLQYHSSSSIRSDQLQRPRSATRWLVMVFPPPAVAQEQGVNVLNAAARSNHGVLLPLFSNMSGQLTAIAREFGFPSTAGICIYLHMADNGLNFTPRVSDESWSILWGNVFDDRHGSHQTSALPIAGRIEFDLDLRKARWYDVWVSNCRREMSGSPPQTLAFGHGQQESRTITEFLPESLADDASMHIQRRVPITRHIPRKLSLLDRIDIAPVKVVSQSTSRVALSPVDVEQITMPIPLPNIMHEEDQTPRGRTISRVDDKIESWRVTSSFAKSPYASTHGQTALDPVNMPNNMSLPDVDFNGVDGGAEGEEGEVPPLNLEDFAWSISSAGPPSADFIFGDSPIEWTYGRRWGRAASVHLDGRLEGSVCLTPSTCTSFGPPDYNHFDYAPSLISRLPSPDIAARAISDCPPTPMTATSWGAPSVWPDSPAESFRAPSVDIATRCLHSRPVTPGTATSWGAPLDWPVSPIARSVIHTPGVGQMFFDDDYEEEELLKPGREAKESVAIWRHVWPYLKLLSMPNTECDTRLRRPDTEPDAPAGSKQAISLHGVVPGSAYPHIVIYPAVYPNFNLYPAMPTLVGSTRDVDMSLKPKYPIMSIYPAVYPAFEIYSGHTVEPQTNPRERLRVRLSTAYPNICVYEPVYPHLVIYPEVKPSRLVAPLKGRALKSTRLSRPLSIQEATLLKKTCELSVKLDKYYPFFRLYPAVYPANLDEIYPLVTLEQCEQQPIKHSTGSTPVITTKLVRDYPSIDIYPAVYPYLEIYPPLLRHATSSPVSQSKAPTKRRMLLPVSPRRTQGASMLNNTIFTQLRPGYPNIDIYPAVYPYLEIYPPLLRHATSAPISQGKAPVPPRSAQGAPMLINTISTRLRPGYPMLDIYPPVYPHLEIYPSIPTAATSKHVSVICGVSYPHFDIYPATYPYFDIYRSGKASTPQYWREPQPVTLDARYPAVDLYPAIYPFFDIYRSGAVCDGELLSSKLGVKLQAKYPCFDIYPAVYPHFDLYPSVSGVESLSLSAVFEPRRTRKPHAQIVEAFLAKRKEIVTVAQDVSPLPHAPISPQKNLRQPVRPRKTHAQIVEKVLDQGFSLVPTFTIQEPEWEMMSLKPPTTERIMVQRLEKPQRRPSDLEFRRSLSLNRAASDRPAVPRGPRILESSAESAAAVTRSSSLSRVASPPTVEPPVLRTSSLRKPFGASRRDSLVLEAARKWGSKSQDKPAQPLETRTVKFSMNDLDEFPLPPLPQASTFPETGRPQGARPASKLDRSKIPFH